MLKITIIKKIKVVKRTNHKTLKFESSDIQVSLTNDGHINKLPFIATFMQIDSPSDGTPCGADSPIILAMEEAQKCVGTMDLMAVDCVWSDWWPEDCMTGHDSRNKIGVVEKAYIEGNEMKMKGFIYALDFPDIAYFIKNATPALGFSMECIADVETKDDGYEHMTNVTFTGVAILFQNLAAFEDTYIDYLAAAKRKGKEELTEQEKREFMASMKELVETAVSEKIGALEEKLEASKAEPVVDEAMKAELEKVKAEKAALEAAKKEAEEKAVEEKKALEQKITDLEANRKSSGAKDGKPTNGVDYSHVWDNGYKNGVSLMFAKMKEEVEGKE